MHCTGSYNCGYFLKIRDNQKSIYAKLKEQSWDRQNKHRLADYIYIDVS